MRRVHVCMGAVVWALGCPPPDAEAPATGATGDPEAGATEASTAEATSSTTAEAPTTGATTGAPAGCGDGVPDPGETCDDGNAIDGDGCNNDCEPSGRLLWERLSGAAGPDMYHAMVLGPDQTLLLGGVVQRTRAGQDRWLLRYDLEGEELWERSHDAGLEFEAILAVARRDAVIYAAGSKYGEADGYDLWIARLDLAGNIVWEDELSSGFGHDYATGLSLTPEGDVVAAGIVGSADSASVWTRRYGSDGAVQWTQAAPGVEAASYYLGPAVAVAGERILVGFARQAKSYEELLLAYPLAGGEAVWQQTTPAAALIYAAAPLGADVVTTGQGLPEQLFVRRIGEDGAVSWQSDACVGAAGRAIAVDPRGDIVVAGLGPGQFGLNARLCKLAPDGQLRWGRDLDGGFGDDFATALAIVPDGRIAMAGRFAAGPAEDEVDGWLAMFTP